MGKSKSVHLGQGIRRDVTYELLRKKVLAHPGGMAAKRDLLKSLFPEEFARELIEIGERRTAQAREHEAMRWDHFLNRSSSLAGLLPYRFGHQRLMREALIKHSHPHKGKSQHRVTDFTSWIYDLYRPKPSISALMTGRRVERDVAIIKKQAALANPPIGWELLYADLLDEKPEALTLSLLEVGGRPMVGAPDYVFFNENKKTILIVEVKVTNKAITSNGWPNLRAQLWAYAHCDAIINITEGNQVILIGEVWSETSRLRQILRWELSDKVYYAQNFELFTAYQTWANS